MSSLHRLDVNRWVLYRSLIDSAVVYTFVKSLLSLAFRFKFLRIYERGENIKRLIDGRRVNLFNQITRHVTRDSAGNFGVKTVGKLDALTLVDYLAWRLKSAKDDDDACFCATTSWIYAKLCRFWGACSRLSEAFPWWYTFYLIVQSIGAMDRKPWKFERLVYCSTL